MRAGLIYAGALLLWLLCGEQLAIAYRSIGSSLFHPLGPDWVVLFAPESDPSTTPDCVLTLANPATQAVGQMPFSIRVLIYLPMATTVSLVFATPVCWSRRFVAALLGIALLGMWVGLGFLLQVIIGFSGESALATYSLPSWMHSVLSYVVEIMIRAPVTKFLVPVVIWGIVTLRREDIRLFRHSGSPSGVECGPIV